MELPTIDRAVTVLVQLDPKHARPVHESPGVGLPVAIAVVLKLLEFSRFVIFRRKARGVCCVGIDSRCGTVGRETRAACGDARGTEDDRRNVLYLHDMSPTSCARSSCSFAL